MKIIDKKYLYIDYIHIKYIYYNFKNKIIYSL